MIDRAMDFLESGLGLCCVFALLGAFVFLGVRASVLNHQECDEKGGVIRGTGHMTYVAMPNGNGGIYIMPVEETECSVK